MMAPSSDSSSSEKQADTSTVIDINMTPYVEQEWIEMKEGEDEDTYCFGMFDDPGVHFFATDETLAILIITYLLVISLDNPLTVFVHEFSRNTQTETQQQHDGNEGGGGGSSSITITLEGYKQENGQLLNSTGLTLWRAAPILCDFLVEKAHLYVENKDILELGAGLGLCGILAGALGAKSVYMTDGDSDSLHRMRDNVARNTAITTKRSGENSGSSGEERVVFCKQLRWGQRLKEFREHCALPSSQGQVHGGFDVIMGSDIIYTNEILEPLFETVDYLLKSSSRPDSEGVSSSSGVCDRSAGEGVFLLAYARRNVKITDVFITAEKYGFVWQEPTEAEGCFIFSRRN